MTARISPPSPSLYVNDAFYDLLRTDLVEWNAAGRALPTRQRGEIEAFLAHEAWLLDTGQFEEWFALYTDDCLYWVPAGHGGDPQTEVTLACDDRRRLGDRITWLRTDKAWSQVPPSRTSHLLSAPVQVPTAVPGEIKIRSRFVVHEYRPGDRYVEQVRALAGWCGHALRPAPDGGFQIARKIVQLLNAEAGHRNLSFLL